MPNRPLVFLDLDGTLFRSWRRVPDIPTVPCAVNRKGHLHGVQTLQEASLYQWLFAHADCIPVTGRNEEEFSNVFFPSTFPVRILSFGTVIYHKGLDLAWKTQVLYTISWNKCNLSRLSQLIARNTNLLIDIGYTYDTPYAVVCRDRYKNPLSNVLLQHFSALAPRYHTYCYPIGGDFSHKPYGVIFITCGVSKKEAVQYIRKQYPERAAIGFGDQTLDMGFLQACDMLTLPKHSELNGLLVQSCEE